MTWTDNIAENVQIDLFKGGSFDQTIIASTISNGTYNWMVPSITEGTDYTVVITSTTNGTIADTSDANFTIQTSGITVTSPNGGEIFDIGNSYDITWNDNISGTVKIDLFKAGAFVQTIVDPTPSDGTYNWTVPSVTEASDYTIVITSNSMGTIADTSDASFTIQTSVITVTSPNGGEIFDIGNSYDITWTDNIAEDVKIDLYKAGAFVL
ncbi:MAG: Ser-Thr-rich GPI-anchored membrane family protein, partial [Ignavibacteriaceae bacterium]